MSTLGIEARAPVGGAPVKAVPTAVLVVDSNARVLAANRSAGALLGRSRAELVGSTMHDLGVSPLVLRRASGEADAGRHAVGATLLRHGGGSEIPIRYQVTRTDLAEGPVYLWAAYVRSPAQHSISRDGERRRAARALGLTGRELEIVQLIADGCGNRQVAERLGISLETVKTYVRRLLAKLDARGRAHAVGIAWRRDLVD